MILDRILDLLAALALVALMLAQSLATEITKKGLAVQKFVGFLKGAKELP